MDNFIENLTEENNGISAIHYGIGWFRQESKIKEKQYTSFDILKLLESIADRLE
ncbi:hypothetical protein [uncultured Clostridium sp.]|uniref:hypothetical protein n=1 Tax=uncultured Clostridium sp. TaxID=59620 RepID=UPI0025DDDCB3|nr:hypothetical protein [uncultured Clostridium sp.]